MNIILGIDPGLRITGYGLIDQNDNNIYYLDGGYICTSVSNLPFKLNKIYTRISELIIQFNPNIFVIEQIFISKNVDSALKLGQARGVAIAAAARFNIPVFEYTTCQIKKMIVGIGNAEKKQVQKMVCKILKTSIIKYDITDALAAAIAHCFFKKSS